MPNGLSPSHLQLHNPLQTSSPAPLNHSPALTLSYPCCHVFHVARVTVGGEDGHRV